MAITIIVVLSTGCRRFMPESQHTSIAKAVNESPQKALSMLDTIDRRNLSERENTFINLMTIKAGLKAGIKPSSDSLIKNVVKFYRRDWSGGLYLESLYWAGKVYSELGDYPTALRYLQDAILETPIHGNHIILRREILLQIVEIYQHLGLYKETVPVISEVIQIDSTLRSRSNLLEDNIKLSETYLLMKDYNKAASYIEAALGCKNNLSPQERQRILSMQALSMHKRSNNDSALMILRKLSPDSIPMTNILYRHIPQIYLSASILDSAYLYAEKLTLSEDAEIRVNGYKTLLSSSLRKYIPTDSLESMLSRYKMALESQVKVETIKETMLQNAYYNYVLHDRARAAVVRENLNLRSLIFSILISVLAVITVTLLLQLRHKNKIIRLQATISDLQKLNESLSENTRSVNDKPSETSTDSLKKELKAQLLALSESTKDCNPVSSAIMKSNPYQELLGYLENEKPVPASNTQIWTELEKVVARSSKNFKPRLVLLLGDNIEDSELHLALLIKCGFSPSNAAILLGRSRSTISYRRAEMCSKLLGNDFNSKKMDRIIRIL